MHDSSLGYPMVGNLAGQDAARHVFLLSRLRGGSRGEMLGELIVVLLSRLRGGSP